MTAPVAIRCIVADDHPAIIDAVCRFLEDEEDIDVLARTSNGEEALALIELHAPQVAVLDVRMPPLGGIEIARSLSDDESQVAVILYTGEGERALVLEAVDAGVRGFLLKESPLADLVRAIRTVAVGGTFIDPALSAFLSGRRVTERLRALSAREREILRMVADGMRNDEVAHRLSISPLTVQTHVKHAMEKLEADTRTHAVAEALRQSIIS
jgi:DNA-binding NarL/FixJ family response regulator